MLKYFAETVKMFKLPFILLHLHSLRDVHVYIQ